MFLKVFFFELCVWREICKIVVKNKSHHRLATLLSEIVAKRNVDSPRRVKGKKISQLFSLASSLASDNAHKISVCSPKGTEVFEYNLKSSDIIWNDKYNIQGTIL